MQQPTHPLAVIQPFQAPQRKTLSKTDHWSVHDTYVVPLTHLGLQSQVVTKGNPADDENLARRLQWAIAHEHFSLLTPFIRVTGPIDLHRGTIPYEIDVNQDGQDIHTGKLGVDANDGAWMTKDYQILKRRLVERIAIANVGLLVSRVELIEPWQWQRGLLMVPYQFRTR